MSPIITTGRQWPLAGEAQRPVHAYGCTRCQREHVEGLDPLYEPHIMSQSKHGTYDRPAWIGEVFRRLVEE